MRSPCLTYRSSFLVAIAVALATMAAGQKLHPQKTYPQFAIGPTGIYAVIDSGAVVKVTEVLAESPAALAGVRAGDELLSAAGQSLDVPDPRQALGMAIGLAEAEDGELAFGASRDGNPKKLTVKLPPLGAYRVTWPAGCPKSRAIIEATTRYTVSSQQDDGSYQFGDERPVRDDLRGCLAGLYLLSTGDESLLPRVRRQVVALTTKVTEQPTRSNWHLGYQGILLAEYYLRTGDRSVLGGLKALCNQAVSAQAAGGWGHGGPPNPGYVQSGLMSSAGVPVLTTLILARECGVEVEEAAYLRAVKFMFRMVGHGCVPYGDHRSELWWSNTNGRNAKLVCALALLDEPRFQLAARHLAMLVVDSYHQPEFGHTGGGFNVIWRGMASVHVPPERASHYQRQMKQLAWYYDLCRQPGGGFSILPTPPDNGRYCGLAWGTGAIGLTYTAPLRTLRITGAPRTRFSVKTEPVAFTWGNDADLLFLGSDDCDGFGAEETAPHEVYDLLLGGKKNESGVAFCAKQLRHFSPLVRTWAARRLKEINSPEAHAALLAAASHADPRVRRAVFDSISGYDNWGRPVKGTMNPALVSKNFLPAIIKTLEDPASAWWEIDGALFALGRAAPDDIRASLPVIRRFTRHEEWYLREAAFWAIVGLHKSITGDEFKLLGDIYGESKHVFARSSYDAGFRMILRNDKVAFDRVTISETAGTLGKTTHKPGVVLGYGTGGIHEAAHRTMMVLEHFDPAVYQFMIGDLVDYLAIWAPYYQHSVWLISGSKWQRGIFKIIDELGADAAPIVAGLKKILANYDHYDASRIGRDAKDLHTTIREAADAWESSHGAVR